MNEEGKEFIESDWMDFWSFITFPLLYVLIVILVIDLVFRYIARRRAILNEEQTQPQLPKLRRDFTVQELREFDGKGKDDRILVAVNGFVFDVTKSRKLYGRTGPYRNYAGRDASRSLAKFSVDEIPCEEYDFLLDLNLEDMEKIREWELQFREKFDVIGRLLRPGQVAINYEDEETCDEDENEEPNPELIGDFEFSSPQFVDKRFYY